jgi:hypothetical protein
MEDIVILFRPTGPVEIELVKASGFRRWPARLPDQPIFYPVTNEEYATQIAHDWNVQASGSGYVTRFKVKRSAKAGLSVCGGYPGPNIDFGLVRSGFSTTFLKTRLKCFRLSQNHKAKPGSEKQENLYEKSGALRSKR